MITFAKNIVRLMSIARTLARHDALFPVDLLDRPPVFIQLARFSAAMLAVGSKSSVGLRPGERLARALHELGPSFIKLGQALSVRSDLLGEELARDLGNLRDSLPPFSYELARQAVEAEFGRKIEDLFTDFEEQPVAAASIAQVHFATVTEKVPNPDTDPDTQPEFIDQERQVAVKILRPDVEKAFQRDLGLFLWLANLVEQVQPSLRRLKPVRIVETMADSVALEMDLRMEAAAASEIAENFAEDTLFHVPTIDWERTGKRVMTQSRVAGTRISDTEALEAAGHDIEALSANVIRIFLLQVLRDGFFHADLHQGNLFVDEDGALVAVDFGIMGRMDRETRLFMAEMLYAFLIGDYRRAAEVHFEAGYVPAHKSVDSFIQACRSIGEPIMGKPVSEISLARLLVQLFQITETFDMETQPQLLLLQKTMVTAEGVAQSLNKFINFWEVAEPTVESWMRENMGPEAKLAHIVDNSVEILMKLPSIVQKADTLLTAMEEKSRSGDISEADHLAQIVKWQQRIFYLGAALLGVAIVTVLAV